MLPPGSEPSCSAGQMNQVTGLTKAVSSYDVHTCGEQKAERHVKANQNVIQTTCPCVSRVYGQGVKAGRVLVRWGGGGGGRGGAALEEKSRKQVTATSSKADYNRCLKQDLHTLSPQHIAT